MSLIAMGAALLFGGVLGGAAGALSRQPEINRLKAQIKQLQEEIQRLNRVVAEQNRQIQELKIRYEALKVYQFMERMKGKSKVKGALTFQYAFMEYMDLLVAQTRGEEELKEEQRLFFNIFVKMVSGENVSVQEKIYVREYVRDKYQYQIDNLIEADTSNVIERIENLHVA
jgi:uncharacterized protein (DUF1800 family)